MPTELDCSIGLSVAETTYGTKQTVSKWLEFVDESFDWDPTFVQGKGLRVGSRVVRSGRRVLGKQMVKGDLTVEAGSKGLGAILNAAFGNVTTTQRATSGVYQQNHTPVTSDYLGSYTIQKGVPLLGGAVQPHTFAGAQCASIEFDCPTGDLVTVKSSWVARDVDTSTAYVSPTYPTPVELMRFAGGAITIGGTVTAATTTALATGGTAVADIRDVNVSFDNGLDDGGFTLGAAGKRARKAAVGLSEIKGKMTAEFDATTLRDAYLNQNDLALVLTFQGTTIIGSGSDVPALQIHVPNIRLEGELPKANGGSVITQSIDFTGFDNLGATSPIVVSYVSTDTAP